MVALLLGGAALLVLLLLLQVFAGTEIKLLMRSLRYTGAAILLLAAIGLAALDRVGLAMLAGSFAWGLFTGGHVRPQMWPFGRPPEPGPDRRFGAGGRSSGEGQGRSASSRMSRAEALRVLGLNEGANDDEVRAAHKRLMLNNHPDRGGSDYLAAKINEARDVLLAG